jgi:hypothetical protein
MSSENANALFHLVNRSQLNNDDKLKALVELDRVAKIETEMELNIAANIKRQLSIHHLQKKDFPRAKDFAEDSLKLLQMMENPHPVELASLMQNLAEIQLAAEPNSEQAFKTIEDVIRLYEEALRL